MAAVTGPHLCLSQLLAAQAPLLLLLASSLPLLLKAMMRQQLLLRVLQSSWCLQPRPSGEQTGSRL